MTDSKPVRAASVVFTLSEFDGVASKMQVDPDDTYQAYCRDVRPEDVEIDAFDAEKVSLFGHRHVTLQTVLDLLNENEELKREVSILKSRQMSES